MYKYGSYLKDALLQDGKISFGQIGTFTLNNESFVQEGNSSSTAPKVVFEYNKRVETSENLVSFVAEKEGKNRRIIAMDIESYLNEMRQLLNTGKEFIIEGIGILFINKEGAYFFVQQAKDALKNEEYARKPKKRTKLFKEPSAGERKNIRKKGSYSAVLIIVLLLLAGGIAAIFYWNYNKNVSSVSQNNSVPVVTDSLDQAAGSPVKKGIDTISAKNDSVLYKFIFEFTKDSSRAHTRVATLRQYGDAAFFDSFSTDTTVLYRLYIAKKILPVDSSTVKDSLQKYFKRDIIIEK